MRAARNLAIGYAEQQWTRASRAAITGNEAVNLPACCRAKVGCGDRNAQASQVVDALRQTWSSFFAATLEPEEQLCLQRVANRGGDYQGAEDG